MSKNIAVIADDYDKIRGGIENHARILVNLLENRGVRVKLINYTHLSYSEIRGFDILIYEGIHRIKLTLLLLLKLNTIKILFTHGSFFLWGTNNRELRKLSGDKHIVLKRIFDILFMRKILQKFDMIITLSNKESDEIVKTFNISSGKIVNLPVFSDEPNKGYKSQEENQESKKIGDYLCYIGRIAKRKNLLTLVKVASELDIPLVIAGKDHGSLIDITNFCRERQYNKLSYKGIVSVEEKFQLLKGASMVVIPSYFEGIPALAVEALKCEKPVVMTSESYMDIHPCITKTKVDFDELCEVIREKLKSSICRNEYPWNNQIIDQLLLHLEMTFEIDL